VGLLRVHPNPYPIFLFAGKLGEAERARGCYGAARGHFADQRNMLLRLVLAEAPADARGAESQPLQALVRLVGGHGGRASGAGDGLYIYRYIYRYRYTYVYVLI